MRLISADDERGELTTWLLTTVLERSSSVQLIACSIVIDYRLRFVEPISAVGRLLLQARLPETRCQIMSVIRRLTTTF